MKKRIFGMLLMGAMVIASVSMFTSCKDYDDDINDLNKKIDAITAQNLQSQLNTLQTALAEAKTAAETAKAAAATAQETATDAEKTAQATAEAAAKAQDVADIEAAIAALAVVMDGAASEEDLAALEAQIAAISENLLTLADVKKLLEDEGFASAAAIEDLTSQLAALNTFKADIEKLGLSEEWKKKVDDAIASLTQIKKDIAGKASQASVDELKQSVNKAVAAMGTVNDFADAINTLNIFVKRNLTSLVLRPDTYYGGIEGISVKIYQLPEEKNNPESSAYMYRYFDRVGTVNVSDNGTANYHVNPTYVDLTNYTVDFYNHLADIKEPAATERVTPTRGGDATGITPVYTKSDDLLKAGKLKNGILTVPFKADAAKIEANLKNGKGTIASLSMTKVGKDGAADTTVNSDYAIVVPEYAYGMLIGDLDYQNLNLDKTDTYVDYIGYDNGVVNSENLHRSFSFLALAATSPTHGIKFDGSFDITSRLVTRIINLKADWEAIKDTVNNGHTNHHAIAKWNETTQNKEEDGDCSIDKKKVTNWNLKQLDEYGFYYDIQLVNYTLGTNKTGESVHLELETVKDAEGYDHVIAYPRNVTADGKTITGETANASAVGRQPIVCIMVKEKATNKIVSFAYMKFLITQEAWTPEAKEAEFDIKDLWVNCNGGEGRVTWSEIEYHILNQLFVEEGGMSKKDFDKNYIFDYYAHTTEKNVDEKGATYETVTRWGVQYDSKGGKRIDEDKAFGSIEEQFNQTSQHVEDATTHIIKWTFTDAQLKDKAEALKAAGKLTDKDKDGKVLDYYVNKDEIVTWVRYAHLAYVPGTDTPAKGAKAEKGNPSIWIKMTIPAGEFHVAKGDMGANKILTYWYDLNSKTNATSKDDAFEVRINVPVPVPEASASKKTIGYYYKGVDADGNPICGDALDIRYDNILELAGDTKLANYTNYVTPTGLNRANDGAVNTYSEFTKDLKDFFIKGELNASVKSGKNAKGQEMFQGKIKNMKLGCEFIYPSKALGNVKTKAETDDPRSDAEIEGSNQWVVYGYTGAKYTLKLDATHTKIQIVNKTGGTKVGTYPKDLITLNYDANATVKNRQITVVNYVNGVDQDDILNYETHNELGQGQTFSAYINIKAIDACAPVYWSDMWFNARFIRPLDLLDPKQALVPDAPNDWHEVDLTDALVVIDWREYQGDRVNRTAGKDVKLEIPVGSKNTPVKAFDFDYYQVKVQIGDGAFYTDAHLGTDERSAIYTLGQMPKYGETKTIKTSDVPNLKFEKISDTKLRYLNNSGVTGGFHVFVPVTMTYVYGFMEVPQTKWVTIGVTSSVEQAMIEGVE